MRHRSERHEIAVAGRTIHYTLSGGVAAHPASGTEMDDLFHAADAAPY